MELHTASRECTAIRSVLRLLQYKRLPQRLKNSSKTFQRTLSSILGQREGVDDLAFLDGTNIGTVTEKENLSSLTAILEIVLQVGVRIKLFKCSSGV